MHLLPYLEYEIHSEKSPEEIYAVLNSVTDSEKWIFFSLSNAEFTGKVSSSDFRIRRSTKRQNSFAPVIKGHIIWNDGQSVISLKMGLHPFVRVFLTVYFGGLVFFLLAGILCVMENSWLLLFSVGFMAAAQLLVRCGFYIPARKSIQRLEALLGRNDDMETKETFN